MTTPNQKQRTRKLVTAALLLALGILLPQAFHIFGQQAGKLFLPMHLPALLAGFLLGVPGCLVGLLLPAASFLVSGMPPPPLLWFMTAELFAYALAAGVFYRKLRLPLWAALLLAQLSGRAFEALALALFGMVLHWTPLAPAMVITGTVAGLPGIALQWLAIPVVVKLIEKHEGGRGEIS